MIRQSKYPFKRTCKWFTPVDILLMTLSASSLRASPIDDERQPEPSDPSAYYDEPEDKAGALSAILTIIRSASIPLATHPPCSRPTRNRSIGPDLIGVTRQRDPAWLSRWIREPERMLAEGDAIATALFERFEKIPVPNLRLDENSALAVIDFLTQETERQQALAAQTR